MTDLQIVNTYGCTMCPARSEFPILFEIEIKSLTVDVFDVRRRTSTTY